jgi:hypothetical protein
MSSITVAGAVIAVVGMTITVRVALARKGLALRLQDQIYLAEGKDYREILSFFQLEDRDLIKANDELMGAGYRIASDQDAAAYLVAPQPSVYRGPLPYRMRKMGYI